MQSVAIYMFVEHCQIVCWTLSDKWSIATRDGLHFNNNTCSLLWEGVYYILIAISLILMIVLSDRQVLQAGPTELLR